MTIETEAATIGIPFHCPACERDVEATLADPLDLLFGGGTLELVCPECDTVFQANVSVEDTEWGDFCYS